MLDLIDVMQWLGLTTLAVVIYVLCYHRVYVLIRPAEAYAVPNWNFHLKRWWAKRVLRKRTPYNESEKRADFQNFDSEQLIGDNQLHSNQFIFGTDSEGNSLLINLSVGKDGYAELWLQLRLAADHSVYTLPLRTGTVHSSRIGAINEFAFEVAGVRFECIRPYHKWRISFAGLLRNTQNAVALDELEFVRFNFFWTMAGNPQHWPGDWSVDLKATALASQPWRQTNWWDYLGTGSYGGFDQFGSLYGQVHRESEVKRLPNDSNAKDDNGNEGHVQTIELNLPGLRQRRWTSYDLEAVHRSCSIVGVCADGSVYVLGAQNLERNLTNAQFGQIRMPNGKVFAIDSTDFHLRNFAEQPEHSIPGATDVRFTANGRTFASTVYTASETTVTLNGQVPRAWRENFVHAEIGLDGEHGRGVLRLWYAQAPAPSTPTAFATSDAQYKTPLPASINARLTVAPPAIVPSLQRPTRSRLTYWLHEEAARSEAIAGGKGASLAQLTESQRLPANEHTFHVSNGFVLSVSTYELHLTQQPTIRAAIERIRRLAHSVQSDNIVGHLKQACDEAARLLRETPVAPEIDEAIGKCYAELCPAGGRVAVRSSAIGEDSADASSAGQNETFLGLGDVAAVRLAVRQCWASLFAERAVEYRRQHLLAIDGRMAVVVQRMVDAQTAGVAFSRDPYSGDPRRVLLTANYGLGETVVSGSVDPDTITVDMHAAEPRIIGQQIGAKEHALRMHDYKLVEQVTSADDKRSACLSEQQIVRIARVAVQLEFAYGNGRDIEWAIDGDDQLHVLQSRPITTLGRWSNWDLLHELDSSVMSQSDMQTFANIGEVMPGCITPLTYSTVFEALRFCVLQSLRHTPVRYRHAFTECISLTHNRLACSVYNLFLTMREANISLIDRLLAIAIAGAEFITPEIHRVSLHRNGIMSASVRLGSFWDAVTAIWGNAANVRRTQQFTDRVRGRFDADNIRQHFGDLDARQFAEELLFELNDEDRFEAVLGGHSLASKASSFTQVMAGLVLAEGASELSAVHYADLGAFLGSCTDVESAEIPTMLEEICDTIYIGGAVDGFLACETTDAIEWLNGNCAAAARQLRNFLARHGHRAYRELELSAITWGQQPEEIVRMLQATCRSANETLLSKAKRSRRTDAEIIAGMRSPQRSLTRRILGWLMALCQRSVQRRETTKSCLIAYVNELRKGFAHLAELMVREGRLANADALWYLTLGEIRMMLRPAATIGYRANCTRLVGKANRRLRLFPAWQELRFDELNIGVPRPLAAALPAANAEGARVHGTTVCEGVLSGRACVITQFADVHLMQAGDVLVTIGTDIAWSTYFPMLGGVVTELGGLISHGAVVAREYGLPCIVGAHEATRRFRHGDRVTLNATEGVLYRVDDSESEV